MTDDLRALAGLVHTISGIVVADGQLASLAARRARRGSTRGSPRGRPAADVDPAELERLIDEVAIKETFFLRHPEELECIDWRAQGGARDRGGPAAADLERRLLDRRGGLLARAAGAREPARRTGGADRRARHRPLGVGARASPSAACYGTRSTRLVDDARRARWFVTDGARAACRRRPAPPRALRPAQPDPRPVPAGRRGPVRPDRLPQRPDLLRRGRPSRASPPHCGPRSRRAGGCCWERSTGWGARRRSPSRPRRSRPRPGTTRRSCTPARHRSNGPPALRMPRSRPARARSARATRRPPSAPCDVRCTSTRSARSSHSSSPVRTRRSTTSTPPATPTGRRSASSTTRPIHARRCTTTSRPATSPPRAARGSRPCRSRHRSSPW